MTKDRRYVPELWADELLELLSPGWGARAAARREWERLHPWRARWELLTWRLGRLQVPFEWRGWNSHR